MNGETSRHPAIITIPSPCSEDWANMSGDERKRLCERCGKNVFNLSQLSAQEVVELVKSSETTVCGRLYRRPDGSVLTRQCPTAQDLEPARSKSRVQFSIASLLILMTSSSALFASIPWLGRKLDPIVQRWLAGPTPPPVIECWEGEIMILEEPDLPPDGIDFVDSGENDAR